MNINNRRYLTHVEYESRGYYSAFSVEFESVAAVMWELYRAILKMVMLAIILFNCTLVKNWFNYVLLEIFSLVTVES